MTNLEAAEKGRDSSKTRLRDVAAKYKGVQAVSRTYRPPPQEIKRERETRTGRAAFGMIVAFLY